MANVLLQPLHVSCLWVCLSHSAVVITKTHRHFSLTTNFLNNSGSNTLCKYVIRAMSSAQWQISEYLVVQVITGGCLKVCALNFVLRGVILSRESFPPNTLNSLWNKCEDTRRHLDLTDVNLQTYFSWLLLHTVTVLSGSLCKTATL